MQHTKASSNFRIFLSSNWYFAVSDLSLIPIIGVPSNIKKSKNNSLIFCLLPMPKQLMEKMNDGQLKIYTSFIIAAY